MADPEKRRAYLLRQGSPTCDGAEELLYFLRDPATDLRLRLPPHAAWIFSALRGGVKGIDEVRSFVEGNFGAKLDGAVVRRYVDLFGALNLDADADTRDLASQIVAWQKLRTDEKKAALVARMPEIIATVPFYSSYAVPKDFASIPIIGKTELREHVHRLSVTHEGARYVWMSSSGTTGERVQAPHVAGLFHDMVLPFFSVADPSIDSDSHWFLFMPAECGGMACNMNPDSTMEERIIGSQLLAPQLGNPSVARRDLLERCAKDCVAWQPTVITGAPSFIYAFARYVESEGIKLPSLRAIFYHVEPASVIHTQRIESALGVRGRSLYIASELGWPAVEQLPGCFVASPAHILEVLSDGKPVKPGEIGNVVITRTTHGSPFLIRYDTRDLARLNADGVTVSRLLGRPNTALVRRADGVDVPSDTLDAAIAEAAAGSIGYYRLFRRGSPSAPRFVFDACASGDGDADAGLRRIGDALRELLGTAVDVRKTNGIPPHRGGRMPLYIDEGE